MTDLHCDVAVIGAGTAGLAAERSARAAGAKTLLIDDRFAGTTCATVGCMPSKLLIAAARAAHAVRAASLFGVKAQAPQIDGVEVMQRVRKERDAFAAATMDSIEEIPDGVRQRGRAHFLDAATLMMDDGRRVCAKAIVIATGSRPHVPPMFQALGDLILTNETIFELETLPSSLAVIGAGPLGLELAQAFARLGVDVDVFDQGERIGGLHDDKVAAELMSVLRKEIAIHLGVSLSPQGNGRRATISWKGPSTGEKKFDYILVAAGRPPQLADLKLDAAGIELDEHGTPVFDSATRQCGQAAVFIAGDAAADRPVLHEASLEGAIAGRNAAAHPKVEPSKRGSAFSIMFTDPPMAVVGAPSSPELVVGAASFSNQGRAKVDAENAGLIHLYAEHPHGRLVGAAMVGPGVDHIAHLIAWAVERGETATALLELPFYHPTVEEGLKPALRIICDAVHAPLLRNRDEGSPSGG